MLQPQTLDILSDATAVELLSISDEGQLVLTCWANLRESKMLVSIKFSDPVAYQVMHQGNKRSTNLSLDALDKLYAELGISISNRTEAAVDQEQLINLMPIKQYTQMLDYATPRVSKSPSGVSTFMFEGSGFAVAVASKRKPDTFVIAREQTQMRRVLPTSGH